MQIHGPSATIGEIDVSPRPSGSIALYFDDGTALILDNAEDDKRLIDALAEVRRLRRIDEALVPPARYEMPLRMVEDQAKSCGHRHSAFTCNRLPGHYGQHEAWGDDFGTPSATWPQITSASVQ